MKQPHSPNAMKFLASLLDLPLSAIECQADSLLGNLGVDSLTMTRVRGALTPMPSYQSLYGLSITEVAEKLSTSDNHDRSNHLEKTQHHDEHDTFDLTPMQESYVIGASQECPCQVYTEFDVESLNIEFFQQAVRLVVKRHPMLHAAIVKGTQQMIFSEINRQKPVHFEVIQAADLDIRRQECLSLFKTQPDLYWDIQLTRLNTNTVRIHLLLDMLFIDATSAWSLAREVTEHYRSLLLQGIPVTMSNSRLEFRDYCNQLGIRQASDASIKYWKERCEWIPGPPLIPRLKQTGMQEVSFKRASFSLKPGQWHALKNRARDFQVTPNALLLSLFSESLRLYAESPNFSIAVTMSERPVSCNNDYSDVVGEFTNILLCSATARQGSNISDRAIAIHHELTEGLEHSDVSGLEVVRMLRKYQSDPHLIFPVVFTSFLGIVRSDLELAGCNTKLNFQQTQTPQITLDHQVYELNGELQVNWDYDSNIYTKDLISDMLRCFQHLLEDVAINNFHAAMLPPEVMLLRTSMNQTSYAFDLTQPSLLHELVLQAAQKNPDAIAVIDQEITLTYSEIIAIAKGIAINLQDCGVSSESCVAIVMEKGWEQVAATIGILLAGATYLPLNPSDPDDRLRSILSLAECSIALIQSKTISTDRKWNISQNGHQTITINVHRNLATEISPRQPISVSTNPDSLAYIIFTSGSTGEPKGVEITHRGAVNTCLDINQRFGFQTNTVTFAISSLSFDLSVWDIFGTLAAGGKIVVCKPEGTRDPDYWLEQLYKHNITVWNTVPTSFAMLIAACPPNTSLPLKAALLSGDAISMTMIENARSLLPELKLVCLGGATEASIWSNFHVIKGSSFELGTDLAPYGQALSNQTIYVLDSHFNYRPAGVVGEIYIGGTGLARGYFRDQSLTAEKFITCEAFGRLYATGDLGRYLSNGEIEILGRKDSQVKVGGHRVELAEIEHCAEELPSVQRAAIIHLPGPAGARLVGFVVTNKEMDEPEKSLRIHIEQHLPDYMSPQTWIMLKEIPLTANSKVDTRKLNQLATSSLQQKQVIDQSHHMETSSKVVLILQLAAQVLDVPVESLSPHHSLVEQGLSSLFAVQLINLLAEAWNTKLSYTLVFNYPSAIQLAEYQSGHFESQVNKKKPIKTDLSEPIAIIGMACRLPGKVTSPQTFWDMLMAGTDCITDVPFSRFDIDEVYHSDPNTVGYSYTRRGAFMEQVESFDHDFFDISFGEATIMDPQQRILLEVAYEAFYTAGYNKDHLRGSYTGVFIGQMNYDWMMNFDYATDYAGTGVSPSITSNRISFTFDLTGPSMTIDTACSSSLVAIDAAVTKLRSGDCHMALAGGINIILCSEPYVTTSQARMLSIDGRCATFDIAANGIARGEGAGAVILKRLSDAEADGDHILALIKGTAVNQDGRSASLTAPSGTAQESVIKHALEIANLAGHDVDYVECHGTGTPLGDPIEVEALKNVLGYERNKTVVLGAVKSNIGHLEGAAGVIGLIKAVEVLRHRVAPGNLHFKTLNPKIDLQGFAAVIPTKPITLGSVEDKTPLVACVSSFGFGGTNAHAVLESWSEPNKVDQTGQNTIKNPLSPPLFRHVLLGWNKPTSIKKTVVSPETVEDTSTDCIYEVILSPSSHAVMKTAGNSLLLSRTPIDSSLPAGWQHAVLDEHDINALLPVLSETNWSTVALLSSGVESDVAMGLQL
nr:amino acid adenylation domain-containing protein [Gammaproteobacteria bacterium]